MTKNKYDILGIGSPFIDHIIRVPEVFLEQVPGAKGGMVVVDFKTLSTLIDKSGVSPIMIAGGSGANTTRGLAHLGHRCALAGRIGKDNAGKHFLEKMRLLNISSCLIFTPTPTAQAVCMITPDGERTMRSFLGASQEMKAEDLIPDMFSGVSLVHIEGYSLLNGNLTERAMHLAKEAGARISFDMGSFEVVKAHKKRIIDLIANYVDVVFANSEETRSLTELNPEQGCGALSDICETAVVLIGAEGSWVGRGSKKVHCPANKVKAIDTTGAGDLFASGFLHGFLEQRKLEECGRFGALTGGAVVQVQGVEISAEGWDSIKREIAKVK